MHSFSLSRWFVPAVIFLVLEACPVEAHAQGTSQTETVATAASLPDAPGAQQTQTPASKSPQDQAAEELKREEKQRILGVVPNFNTVNSGDAAPLTPKQKLHLFWKSSTDPFVFVAAAAAGISQAEDDFP